MSIESLKDKYRCTSILIAKKYIENNLNYTP